MKPSPDPALRRAYLLGEASERARASLEQEYFDSDSSFEGLLTLESELIDAYVDRSLSRRERKLFARRLQTSARLRRRVEFAEALAQRVRGRTPGPAWFAFSSLDWLRNVVRGGAPVGVRLATIAMLLIALSTMLVWVARRAGDDARTLPHAVSSPPTLPLAFEINRGQTDPAVRFFSRTQAYSVFLTPGEAVFELAGTRPASPAQRASALPFPTDPPAVSAAAPRASVVRMRLVGAHRVENPRGGEPLPGRSHYFNGSNPAEWITDVTRFARVEYDDVYDGIDLAYYGDQGRLEHDFIVAPGVDPGVIAMAFDGADRLELDQTGALDVWVGDRPLRWETPVLYQDREGVREIVSGAFDVRGDGTVGFVVGPYDRTRPLTIDPVVVYATYVGGAGFEAAVKLAVDDSGAAYVTGVTTSADFPLAGGSGRQLRGTYDAFVTKINPAGTELVYAAYLGGAGDENFGHDAGIAVDANGAVYLTGWTDSTDFPVTPGALQTVPGRTFTDGQTATVVDRWPIFGHDDIVCCPDGIVKDAFITKLSPDGSRLEYSTYLGRGFDDEAQSITVDRSGHAYVVGYTASDAFPTTEGAFQRLRKGGFDIFAAKLSIDGTRLVYSTYIGGSGIDLGHPHVMDGDGNLYIVGSTYSTDFPLVNAVQAANRGAPDGFVLKLDPTGSHLVYSTYLGGTGEDRVVDIAIDSAGSAYAVGYTRSSDFPLAAPSTSVLRGTHAAFVTQLSPRGTVMLLSTLLDGAAEDVASGVAVDGQGRVYVAGSTSSPDFPVSDNALQTWHGGDHDAYLAVFQPRSAKLLFSTFLGGARPDSGTTVEVDPEGAVYVAGFTDSENFPATPGSVQQTHGAGRDVFVMKLRFDWLEP